MDFGDAKERIRQKVDIVDLVGSHLALRRQGRNYVALCPWHDDRKPSLQINPDRQTWKCWVCDIGGDIFSFTMQREGCDFREALKLLAERAGIDLDEGWKNRKKVTPGSPDDKKTLYDCCAWAGKLFHEFLLNAEPAEVARQYVEERAITPLSVEKFSIGFAPNEWTWLVDKARGTPYSPAVLEACGLVGQNERGGYYDFFKGRLIFPIRDAQGKVIAFGGRAIPKLAREDDAKYKNGRETRLFSKSEQLYALDIARVSVAKSRAITVVEGYTDVIMCHQHGVEDVVAVLGTALTDRHIPLLRRFADTIYLILDGDEAGQRRTNDILEQFVAANLDLRILTLPEEFDPAEFLVERGSAAFRGLRETAVDALEHKIRTATAGIDLTRETHRANQALESILATLARAASSSGADTLRMEQLLTRVAREFRLDETVVRNRLGELRRGIQPADPRLGYSAGSGDPRRTEAGDPRRTLGDPRRTGGDSPPTQEFGEGLLTSPQRRYKYSELTPREAELLELLALHPELAPTALQEIADDDLELGPALTIFQTYRRLEEAGDALEFGRVLAEMDEPNLKSLLVQLDDAAARKEVQANIDPPARMRAVIRSFQRHHEERERKAAEAALAEKRFDEQEETSVLLGMIAAKRRQQGIIVAPTDG